MKYLRKFDSVSDMETAIASSEIDFLGLAYDNGQPVMHGMGITPPTPPTPGPDYSIPFYVENITQQNETLTIAGYDRPRQDNYLEILVEYSTDGTAWSSLGTTGEMPLTRTLQPGDKVYLRATTNAWYVHQDGTEEHDWQDAIDHGCAIFGVSKVGGNIMSLLYGSNFTGNETTFPIGLSYIFGNLFENMNDMEEYNRNLVSASELLLPATTLTQSCYSYMFCNCTSLTTAPALPATTLADVCYSGMFCNCTSLTTAPALPATTLVTGCYEGMFSGCPNLNYIKCLATDISAEGCTSHWVSDVETVDGIFVKDPNMMSWTTGTNGIPLDWTVADSWQGILLSQINTQAIINVVGLDNGTGYYTINNGNHIPLSEGVTTINVTQAMDGQRLVAHGEFNGEVIEERLDLEYQLITVTMAPDENEYTYTYMYTSDIKSMTVWNFKDKVKTDHPECIPQSDDYTVCYLNSTRKINWDSTLSDAGVVSGDTLLYIIIII